MTEEIKELIAKINREGIEAAGQKAEEIEAEARKRAQAMISQAKKETERLLSQANERIARTEEKEKAQLAQAARDILLSLKQEINVMLSRLITSQVKDSLSPQVMAGIITGMLKSSSFSGQEVIISLSPKDKEALEQGLLAKLKEETRKNIILRPQEGILAGFTISFDAGKSQFDFSAQALAEYIGTYLKPKLKDILEEAVS